MRQEFEKIGYCDMSKTRKTFSPEFIAQVVLQYTREETQSMSSDHALDEFHRNWSLDDSFFGTSV